MATASKQTVTTPVVTTTFVDIETVTLVLTKDEAETLRIVLGSIGGASDVTRRGHTDEINAALRMSGVDWKHNPPKSSPRHNPLGAQYSGYISFSPESN